MDASQKMIIHEGWPYQPDKCLADDDFIDFCKKEEIKDRRIFHMGPGLHHRVGKELSELNAIVSITNSRDEYLSYIDLVENNPSLLWNYQLLFTDIYSFNSHNLNFFNVINLFHLAEAPDERKYGVLDDIDVVSRMLTSLEPDGFLIGYKGSSAWDRAYPILADAAEMHGMHWLYDYNSLRIWHYV